MVAGRSVRGAPIILIVSTANLLDEGGVVTSDKGFIVSILFWGTVIRVVALPGWLINHHSRKGIKEFSSETFRTIISRHPSLRIDSGTYKLQGFFCPPPHGATAPSEPGTPHYRSFTITLRHTTLGTTPLDEWSDRRRDLCLTSNNTRKRQPCPQRDSNLQSQQASCGRLTH